MRTRSGREFGNARKTLGAFADALASGEPQSSSIEYATALAEIGDIAGAKSAADAVSDPLARAECYGAVGRVLAGSGDVRCAREWAGSTGDALAKTYAFVGVGSILAEANVTRPMSSATIPGNIDGRNEAKTQP